MPQKLDFKPLGAPAEVRTPNGPGTLPLSKRSSLIVARRPEGFPSGFANIFFDAAEAIAARRWEYARSALSVFSERVGWSEGYSVRDEGYRIFAGKRRLGWMLTAAEM